MSNFVGELHGERIEFSYHKSKVRISIYIKFLDRWELGYDGYKHKFRQVEIDLFSTDTKSITYEAVGRAYVGATDITPSCSEFRDMMDRLYSKLKAKSGKRLLTKLFNLRCYTKMYTYSRIAFYYKKDLNRIKTFEGAMKNSFVYNDKKYNGLTLIYNRDLKEFFSLSNDGVKTKVDNVIEYGCQNRAMDSLEYLLRNYNIKQ